MRSSYDDIQLEDFYQTDPKTTVQQAIVCRTSKPDQIHSEQKKFKTGQACRQEIGYGCDISAGVIPIAGKASDSGDPAGGGLHGN